MDLNGERKHSAVKVCTFGWVALGPKGVLTDSLVVFALYAKRVEKANVKYYTTDVNTVNVKYAGKAG